MATCKYYLEKPYLPNTDKKLKSSQCSIYLIFTVNRENRLQIRVDEKIEPRFWDFKKQRVKGTHPRYLQINLYLQKIETDLQNLYYNNRDLPFQKFKALAIGSSSEKKTLFVALRQFINLSSQEKDSKTVAKFLTLEKHLEIFDKVYPFDFPTLDFNFYDRFKTYLYAIPNQYYLKHCLVNKGDYWDMEKGNHGETVGIFDDQVFAYIRQIKTFLKWAEKREHKVHPSYKNWKIIRRVHDPVTLTFEELYKLEEHNFSSKALDVARDYLVMECRTGQRISDIKRIQLKDFSSLEYTFTPRKGNRLSNKEVTIYFRGYFASALNILLKYKGKMPVISEQTLNYNIKRACKEAGIDSEYTEYRWAGNKRVRFIGPKYEFISTHIGRKTAITLLLQEGFSRDDVMEFVGIDDIKTLKHYKGKFDKNRLLEKLEGIESKAIMKVK